MLSFMSEQANMKDARLDRATWDRRVLSALPGARVMRPFPKCSSPWLHLTMNKLWLSLQ